jgi:hypothetical protein
MWSSDICNQYSKQAHGLFVAHAPTVAFLTGAGASKALGLPIMNEFFEHLVGPDLVQRMQSATAARGDMVIQLLRAAYPDVSTQVFDLERVMMLIQTLETGMFRAPDQIYGPLLSLMASGMNNQKLTYATFTQQLADQRPAIAATFKAIAEGIDLILHEFNRIFGFVDPVRAFALWQPLLEWARRTSRRPVPIFTTNYDIAIEQAAAAPGFDDSFMLQSGFAPGHQAHTWCPTHYTADDARSTIWLFKLHGSASWCISRSTGELLLQPEGQPIYPDPTYYLPAIRLPYESKSIPSADVEPIYHVQYQALQAALSVVKVFVVIGLSFRDDTLRHYFRQALERRDDLVVVAIAPVGDSDTEQSLNYGLQELSQYKNFHRLDMLFNAENANDLIREISFATALADLGDAEKSA